MSSMYHEYINNTYPITGKLKQFAYLKCRQQDREQALRTTSSCLLVSDEQFFEVNLRLACGKLHMTWSVFCRAIYTTHSRKQKNNELWMYLLSSSTFGDVATCVGDIALLTNIYYNWQQSVDDSWRSHYLARSRIVDASKGHSCLLSFSTFDEFVMYRCGLLSVYQV